MPHMSYESDPNRWWFSIWDGPVFDYGWAFGKTAAEAMSCAKRELTRWNSRALGGAPRIIVQQSVLGGVNAEAPLDSVA